MKPLAYLLLAATLLAAPACSEDDPEPTAAATGRYTLDGRQVVATSVRSSRSAGSAGNDDMLYIELVGAATGGGSETLEAIYAKRVGTPESAYRPLNLRYTASTGVTYFYSLNLALTLTRTDRGYSGTFAGTFPGLGRSQISDGAFTDVQ